MKSPVFLLGTPIHTRLDPLFASRAILNSSQQGFNKVPETFLSYFGTCWLDTITLFLQIFRPPTPSCCEPPVPSLRWSVGLISGDCTGHSSKLKSLFLEPAWGDLDFVAWFIFCCLEYPFGESGHKGKYMPCHNAWVYCGFQIMLSWY